MDEVEIGHLLAELLRKLLNDWSSLELLCGETQDVPGKQHQTLSGSTHSDRSAPTHARAHTQPENVHRSGLTGLLVLTQTQDEASEERRDGTRLPLLTQQRRCLRSLLQHLAQQK